MHAMSSQRVDAVPSPVYDGFADPPPSYPLGVPIKEKVTVKEIDRRTADRMYQAHHSYIARGRQGWHYGVYFEDKIVGAITFDCWPCQETIHGYESENVREVARVCIAHNTPNVASCAMAKAQDLFLKERGDGIELLVTYVREDYDGSMFAALSGKGWEKDGHITRGHDPGNRQMHEIHEHDKERWVCYANPDRE